MEELTVNVKLSPIALELRAFRIQSGLSSSVIAEACNIRVNDLIAFETGTKKPSRRQLKRLECFYLVN